MWCFQRFLKFDNNSNILKSSISYILRLQFCQKLHNSQLDFTKPWILKIQHPKILNNPISGFISNSLDKSSGNPKPGIIQHILRVNFIGNTLRSTTHVNTYPIHTQFVKKNIPFTYLWAPKIHTFLSIKYIGASFLAQPNEYAAVKENRMTKPIRLGEGVQFLRWKSLVLQHSKTFWASLPFQIAGKHKC